MQKFDDDLALEELLDEKQRQRLEALLTGLSGSGLSIVSRKTPTGEPVEFNLETVAWLTGEANRGQLQAAASLASFVLTFVAKYRLAANLHKDITEASYQELKKRNEALEASEARYRGLSEQLQKRVDEQVSTIRQAQQELFQSAHLRSIGQLSAGVAHEINNPIGFINSNLRVASEYLKELESVQEVATKKPELLADFHDLLSESADGARRISSIVADLKTFSSIDQADYTVCNLKQLIPSVIQLIKTEFGADVAILARLEEVPMLQGHPGRLSQAFFNLVENAVLATRPGETDARPGKILVKLQATESEVSVIIQDNGCGIPVEHESRVFDAFFTTRPVGSGTGLGLAVVRDVVAAHNGLIRLETREQIGTRVTLTFPIV